MAEGSEAGGPAEGHEVGLQAQVMFKTAKASTWTARAASGSNNLPPAEGLRQPGAGGAEQSLASPPSGRVPPTVPRPAVPRCPPPQVPPWVHRKLETMANWVVRILVELTTATRVGPDKVKIPAMPKSAVRHTQVSTRRGRPRQAATLLFNMRGQHLWHISFQCPWGPLPSGTAQGSCRPRAREARATLDAVGAPLPPPPPPPPPRRRRAWRSCARRSGGWCSA